MSKKGKLVDRIDETTKKLKGPCSTCNLWFTNFNDFCKEECESWKELEEEDQQHNEEIINSFWKEKKE